MKPPRAALLALCVLAASAARAHDLTIIGLDDNNGVYGTTKLQHGSDWKILKVQAPLLLMPDMRSGNVFEQYDPKEKYFLVPANIISLGGPVAVMEVRATPFPGALSGEPVNVFGPNGKKLPTMWLQTHDRRLIDNESALWTMPAGNFPMY